MSRGLISSLFFPDRCCFCGDAVYRGDIVCDECRHMLDFDPDALLCPYCALPVDECKCGRAHFFDLFFAPYKYEGPVRESLLRYKYASERDLSRSYARIMSDYISLRLNVSKIDAVCAVPQTKKETAARGFDQNEALAKELAFNLSLPFERMLVKLCDTPHQHDLPELLRMGNLRGVFDLSREAGVEGKTILLVDDIMTSGATFDECAAVLKIFGAGIVIAAAFATTPLDRKEQGSYRVRRIPPDAAALLRTPPGRSVSADDASELK